MSASDEQRSIEELPPKNRKGVRQWGITVASTLLGLCVIIYSSGAFATLGIPLGRAQVIAFCMPLALSLAFLLHPAKKGASKRGLPWYDALLITGGFVGSYYIAFWYELVMEHVEMGIHPPYEIVLAGITIVVVIEATRRVAGSVLSTITSVFLLYPLVCNYLPGILRGRRFGLDRLAWADYLSSTGIFGTAAGVAIVIVLIFIIFGQFMIKTGAGTFFINLAFAGVGHMRGGAAKAAVLASGLFGMISGSSAANVATTGVITIPLMKKVGYPRDFAGGVETVSSNGGQLMPPVMGAVAFIIAEFLGMSYIQVCISALVPAILYFIVEFVQIDLESAKRGFYGAPRSELPSLKETMLDGWHYLLPILVMLVLLVLLLYSPQRSASGALFTLIIISSFRKGSRLNIDRILGSFEGAAAGMCLLATVCASAGIIIGSITMTGLGMKLSSAIIDISGGNLAAMLGMTAVACYVLGMGIGGITIYIILAILIGPALVQMGVIPIAAHLFIFWWGLTSYITPPVCVAAFVAAGIAEGNPMRTGWYATRLGIINLILPFIFVFEPSLLLIGPGAKVILPVITALAGAITLGAALSGYLLKPCGSLERIALAVAALALLWPGWETDIPGGIILVATVLWQLKGVQVYKRESVISLNGETQ